MTTTSPFKEFRIVLPIKAAETLTPRSNVQARVEMELIDHFGGYTRMEGQGGWWSETRQERVEEPIYIYDVATGCSIKAQHRALSIVRFILSNTHEEAVYYRDLDGVVHIIERD